MVYQNSIKDFNTQNIIKEDGFAAQTEGSIAYPIYSTYNTLVDLITLGATKFKKTIMNIMITACYLELSKEEDTLLRSLRMASKPGEYRKTRVFPGPNLLTSGQIGELYSGTLKFRDRYSGDKRKVLDEVLAKLIVLKNEF